MLISLTRPVRIHQFKIHLANGGGEQPGAEWQAFGGCENSPQKKYLYPLSAGQPLNFYPLSAGQPLNFYPLSAGQPLTDRSATESAQREGSEGFREDPTAREQGGEWWRRGGAGGKVNERSTFFCLAFVPFVALCLGRQLLAPYILQHLTVDHPNASVRQF